MAVLDPTVVRLSPHFLLSDFMGCNSVYSRGLPNVFDKRSGHDVRLDNGRALCEHALEPLLAQVGSFSISYGFISPELSREIVTYQDPNKPSHHRWDLGAAADICPHHYVLQSTSKKPLNDEGAPIRLALEHMQELPLSRLITYSESPYLCVAVSADEVAKDQPRMAWYENRYTGKKSVKPDYRKYPTQVSRDNALKRLEADGLDHPWRGGGYPSYHGGGKRQLHHLRASKYTMVSDFLFDQEWVQDGVKNIPVLNNPGVASAFKLAGAAYDDILKLSGLPRLSIVSGYTSHHSKGWIQDRDWRAGEVTFEIVPPEYKDPRTLYADCMIWPAMVEKMDMDVDQDRIIVRVKRGAYGIE